MGVRERKTHKQMQSGGKDQCGWNSESCDRRGELSMERVDKVTSGQALSGWLREKNNANALGARTI